MKHSKHFKSQEGACKCCGRGKLSQHLIAILELVRLRFGEPVNINSGFRCDKHNAAIGGATHSYHKLGQAADIWIKRVEPEEIYKYLCDLFPVGYGFICYSKKGFVHIDVRSVKWRGDDFS